jgi:hypothetical protein
LIGAALALAAGLAAIAQAQQATEYRPDRIRALMTSIHGYTRAGLEAASTNVDEILMSLADDEQELMLVRRQAIKGLRLYPTAEVLSFIEQESVSAPANLKRLYLSSAAGFAQGFPERVRTLAETHLNDESVNVRFSALKLSGALEQGVQVRTMLQNRLALEPDQKLRSAIQARLNAN